MIILKHNNIFYVAMSFEKINYTNEKINKLTLKENITMWHPDKKGKKLIAFHGLNRLADLTRYQSIFPENLEPKELVFKTYEKLKSISMDFDLYCDNLLSGDYVFIENDKAFILFTNGECFEIEDILFDTEDDKVVSGLHYLKQFDNPYDFFREAYRLLEQSTNTKMFPFAVMNSSNNKLELIEK